MKLFNKSELKANLNYKIDLVELLCMSNYSAFTSPPDFCSYGLDHALLLF